MKRKNLLILSLLLLLTLCTACEPKTADTTATVQNNTPWIATQTDVNITINGFDISTINTYQGEPYVIVNDNIPFFTDGEKACEVDFLSFSDLDSLERPQTAYVCLSQDSMPAENEERGEIGQVKPAGWHTIKYPDTIPDLYLYNRCHLIGWQLCGENANEKNLITGTRYLNIEGMLPFENQIAQYLRENENNRVLYRVTPIYTKDNLIADGLLLEAVSLHKTSQTPDLQLCVYCYNVQPGICIDYQTGESYEDSEMLQETINQLEQTEPKYILNTKTKKIHTPDCIAVTSMSDKNKAESNDTIKDLQKNEYTPCEICNPKP